MLLITGGWGDGTGLTSVEVVSLSSVPLSCSVPPILSANYTYQSYHTQDGEVTCGGTSYKSSCVSLTASGWTKSHDLVEWRFHHSSWSSPAGLLLMGGISGRTTELLSDTGSSSSPSFDLEYDTE